MLPLRCGAGEEQAPRPTRGRHLLQAQKDNFGSPRAGMTPCGDDHKEGKGGDSQGCRWRLQWVLSQGKGLSFQNSALAAAEAGLLCVIQWQTFVQSGAFVR